MVRQTLEVCADVEFLIGVGLSHQVLGRIAQVEEELTEAERHLQEALRTLGAIGSRFELARTHLDLASLAHARGDREAAASQLNEAQALFRALRVPKYVKRAAEVAREFGVSLLEQAAG